MEDRRKDARREAIIADLEALVPKDHLLRKIERVFADAKEKHAMRYTHHRGLAAVTRWVRLKFAAMNLKKLAQWSWRDSIFACFPNFQRKPMFSSLENMGSLTGRETGKQEFACRSLILSPIHL